MKLDRWKKKKGVGVLSVNLVFTCQKGQYKSKILLRG